MKKFLLWGLAIILALGIIGGMMDSETPQADPTDVVLCKVVFSEEHCEQRTA